MFTPLVTIVEDIGSALSCLNYFLDKRNIVVDTETTGLEYYGNDHLLGFGLYDGNRGFYIPHEFTNSFVPLFSSLDKTFIFHNATFDIHFLPQIKSEVYCTLIGARLEHNERMSLTLESLGQEVGAYKSDKVKEFLDANGYYRSEEIPGKKGKKKIYEFKKVPLILLAEYCLQDCRVTWELFKRQVAFIQNCDNLHPRPIRPLVKLEQAVIPIVSKMEARGIRVDVDYCKQALDYYENRRVEIESRYKELTGAKLIDSAKGLAEVLRAHGVTPGTTLKGNDSFTSEVLEKFKGNKIADLILEHRDVKKTASTYFSSFLYYARHDGRIHPSIRQAGAATGRFASSSPNLQNLTSDNDGEYPVRGAFVPDSPEHLIFSADYQAQEYRLLMDYANEEEVIAEIIAGKDVHQACAEMMGVDRKTAKNCIAIGSLILTDSGLKEIQNISIKDKLWDGIEFVSHEGVIFKGYKEVIEYDGLRATKDHKVYLHGGGSCTFKEAVEQGFKLARGEMGGAAIWYTYSGKGSLSYRSGALRFRRYVQSVFKKVSSIYKQFFVWENQDMSVPKKSNVWGGIRPASCVHSTKIPLHETTLQKQKKSTILSLWWQGDKIIAQWYRTCKVFVCKLLKRTNSYNGDRSYRQQRALRSIKHSSCNFCTEPTEQEKQQDLQISRRGYSCTGFTLLPKEGLPILQTFFTNNITFSTDGGNSGRDSRQEAKGSVQKEGCVVQVFDILNSGPRNRFCASGKIVSNCSFSLLYGAGALKLAASLGVSESEARRLKELYFRKLPKVSAMIQRTVNKAKTNGVIVNWMGRRCFFKDKNFAYKAPNYLIQGGCADIMRHALVKVSALLEGTRSTINMTIHDEILGNIHKDELELLPKIRQAMIESYPYVNLPMDVSVKTGDTMAKAK